MQICTSYTCAEKRSPCTCSLGDTVIGVIKIATPNRRIEKHEICKCLIVRDPTRLIRLTVVELNLRRYVVLFLKKIVYTWNTNTGPVYTEFRERGYLRVVSLAL